MASRMANAEALVMPNAPHALNYSRPHDLVDAIMRAAAVEPTT